MKIIIPMAGMGKRMRPHTLTIPKPLLPIAGKPIVERLVEEIVETVKTPVSEIAFVIGRFGEEVENNLKAIAQKFGSKASIYYQDEPLGTAHAVWCARPSLDDETIVAFADTLFKADFNIDNTADGNIFVKQVPNPAAFGVVKTDNNGVITDFIEKPQTFVSDLAIIGIYHFRSGAQLLEELQSLIDNKRTVNGEYQLTDALENMKLKGLSLKTATVSGWFDCGNKDATVDTNKEVLRIKGNMVSDLAIIDNAVIIPPCYIGENVKIANSVIGPYTSVEAGAEIVNSLVRKSIIQQDSRLIYANLNNSMVGKSAKVEGKVSDISISDFSTMH